jgi:hypothetical protein
MIHYSVCDLFIITFPLTQRKADHVCYVICVHGGVVSDRKDRTR